MAERGSGHHAENTGIKRKLDKYTSSGRHRRSDRTDEGAWLPVQNKPSIIKKKL
jgi:hypothetical protein